MGQHMIPGTHRQTHRQTLSHSEKTTVGKHLWNWPLAASSRIQILHTCTVIFGDLVADTGALLLSSTSPAPLFKEGAELGQGTRTGLESDSEGAGRTVTLCVSTSTCLPAGGWSATWRRSSCRSRTDRRSASPSARASRASVTPFPIRECSCRPPGNSRPPDGRKDSPTTTTKRASHQSTMTCAPR